ncbi:dsRBD fold-containing protein [Actinoplanes sp. NPDC049548]|uniref:dsRBD fold-containing protein n=1 Tax=Actinoplanes sp. NPDC049548 TaxID=3155152 RepID=UPI00342895D9
MTHVRTWTVQIAISEHEDERRTHADAILHGARMVRGEGQARRRPSDREVPEIGDELAAARALADLAYKLLDVAAGDIEQFTHRPVHLTS